MEDGKIQAILDEASDLLEAGKPAETLTCLKRISGSRLEADDQIEVATLSGWAMSDLGQHDQAIGLLESALDDFPEEPRLLSALGVALSNAGDLDEAKSALEQALALDDEDESTLANLGLVHERLRDYKRALEFYERAVDRGADIDWLLQRKAAVHAELGDLKTARSTLRRYLSLAPEDAGEWLSLGMLHSDDNEFEQAFACFRESEKISPDSAMLRLNWGVAAVRARDFDLAWQQHRYLERLEPGGSRPTLLRAFILDDSGDVDGARACYEAALGQSEAGDSSDTAYALEMAMDFASRRGPKAECERLLERAYGANACTVELCEALRESAADKAEEAAWFSLVIEADYRDGLCEVVERDTPADSTPNRYARNIQVIARDRDEATTIVQGLLARMKERNVRIREFVTQEVLKDAHVGLYEIDRESIVFRDAATQR